MTTLSIKHPTLRPRVFDPFLPSDDRSERTPSSSVGEDVPGAIAMRGPDARRGENILVLTDDDISDYNVETAPCNVEEYDSFAASHHDRLSTTDDETQTTGLDLEEAQNSLHDGGRSKIDHRGNPMKPESRREKFRRLCVAGGFVSVGLAGIIAIVLVLALLGFDRSIVATSSSPPPASSPSNIYPPPTSVDDNRASADWNMVSEIVGSVHSFGFQVDFNMDGSIVAVAAPRARDDLGQVEVFQRTGDQQSTANEEWERVGDPIVGDSEGDYASLGMDLSSDGNYVAVGYPGNGYGFVRVFRLDGKKWEQQGQTLAGPSFMSKFGSSLSVAENGTSLVVGAPLAGDQEQGMAQVYKWTPESQTWIEDGNTLQSGTPGDRFGSTVGMSNNGNVVAIGAPGDDTSWKSGGRIYFVMRDPSTGSSDDCMSSGCWRDVLEPDSPVVGESTGDKLGQRFVLTSNGDAVIASSVSYNDEVVDSDPQHVSEGSERHQIGVGKIRVITFLPSASLANQMGSQGTSDSTVSSANEIWFAIFGSANGEGLGYDVAANQGLAAMLAATSLNGETHTGVARVYENGSGRHTKQGNDIGSLPLGSRAWEGIGPMNYAGPSISMAGASRIAIGYQSVLLEEEDVPGVVRIFQYQGGEQKV